MASAATLVPTIQVDKQGAIRVLTLLRDAPPIVAGDTPPAERRVTLTSCLKAIRDATALRRTAPHESRMRT
jgi:hypothetical protein